MMSGPNFTAEEAAAIGTNYPQSTRGLQRISHRARPVPLIISPPTPLWAEQYETLRSRIESALAPATITTTSHDGDGDQRPRGETKPFLLSVAHVGSTSVPGLPAKAVIDVDVVVADPADEASYVGRLVGDGWEATGTGRGGGAGAGRPAGAGLQFMLREPAWHGHRFFVCEDPPANVHVFGPGCPETVRHRIFRDWLVEVSGLLTFLVTDGLEITPPPGAPQLVGLCEEGVSFVLSCSEGACGTEDRGVSLS